MRLCFFLFLFLGLTAPLRAEEAAGTKGFHYGSQVIVNDQELPDGALIAMDQTADVAINIARQILLTGGTVGSVPAAMKFTVIEEPKHGILDKTAIGSGVVTYQPASDYQGEDSFSFAVDAGGVMSKPATVRLKVVPQAQVSAPAPQAGTLIADEFTKELNEKSREFFKEQQERRADFFRGFKPEDMSPEEQQKKILEFRQSELKRERKFREKQQQLIEKQGQDSFLDEADSVMEDIALFLKLRDPSREELEKQKNEFLEKAKQKRSEFYIGLQSEELTAQEKLEKIQSFEEKALKEKTRFFEGRREMIAKQAMDPAAGTKTDEELRDQIKQFFDDLL